MRQDILKKAITPDATELIAEIKKFAESSFFEKPFALRPETRAHLESLEPARLQKILSSFRPYSDMVVSALETDPESRNDEARLLKHIAQQMRLIFSEDVYSLIQKDDLIEIYNEEFVQVYRGLSFMGMSNYTLPELLSYEFYELYERSASVNEHLFTAAQLVRERGTLAGVSLNHVPGHLTREKFSTERAVFQINFRHFFPIYQWPKKFYGYLIIQSAKPYVGPDAETEGLNFI